MVGEAVQGHFENFPVLDANSTVVEDDDLLLDKKIEFTVTLSLMVGIFQVSFNFFVTATANTIQFVRNFSV